MSTRFANCIPTVRFQGTFHTQAQHILAACGAFVAWNSSRCEAKERPSGATVELRDWLTNNGGHFANNICIEQISGRGFGIVNRGSIKQGQILLRVPWKLILRRDLVEEDAVLKETLQKWASDDEKYTSQAIRLWLLYKTHSDDWSPWLYRLPHDIAAGAESLPLALAFSGRSSTLRGTPLQLAAEVQLEGLRSEWGQLKQFLDVSLEKFIWAQAVVSTRSSTLPMDGQVYSCLIPVVDFVNHDFYPNALIKGTKQGVELISSEDIPEGREILISYGQHDPFQFFFAFGFLPEMDVTEMRLPLKSQEPCLLRANRADLEELLSAMGPKPKKEQLAALQRFLKLWRRELQPSFLENTENTSALELRRRMMKLLDDSMKELEEMAVRS